MSTLGVSEKTKTRFDAQKATVAYSMSADEFLQVLLNVWEWTRTKKIEVPI